MTAQELIIGHYEGALTAVQEADLQRIIGESPEARALFEQHGNINTMMHQEAESIAPSEGLAEVTVASALGLLTQSVGGATAGAWFTAKMVAIYSAVIIGGASVVYVATTVGDGPETAPAQPAGAEQIITSEPATAPTVVVDESAQTSESGTAASSGISEERNGQNNPKSANNSRAVARTNSPKDTISGSERNQPSIDLNRDNPVDIDRGPATLNPGKQN